MWGLLVTTLFTSAADSLNPMAITQQFVLQGMVKKPRHIWYFIIPTGVVNLATGFLAYFGLIALMGRFLGGLMERHGRMLLLGELLLGIALCLGAAVFLGKRRARPPQRPSPAAPGEAAQAAQGEQSDRQAAARRIKSVSPAALVALGVGATVSELTTALPYFAFLGILLNHQLALPQLALILVLYNLIYMLPLMILYFVYVKAQNQFDRLYRVIKAQIAKWAGILAPAVMGLMGAALTYHAVALLLQG